MSNSSRNIFCFEKAELKGMKNESGEINVGAREKGWAGRGQLLPRRVRGETWGRRLRLGCDQHSVSCLEASKCQSFHLSLGANTGAQNGWFWQELKSKVGCVWGMRCSGWSGAGEMEKNQQSA